MSVSRMKVALTKSHSQRPCVSRKWTKEGLGRKVVRSQVHISAVGAGRATQMGPPSKTGSSQRRRWELGTRARMDKGGIQGSG